MRKLIFAVAIFLMITSNAFSQDTTPPDPPTGLDLRVDNGGDPSITLPFRLCWNRSTEPDLAFYTIYFGTSPRNYNHFIDVDSSSTCLIFDENILAQSGIFMGAEGLTLYVAMTETDYSLNESEYSRELIVFIEPTLPPEPTVISVGDSSGIPGSSENPIEISLENPDERVTAIAIDICDVDDYLYCSTCEVTERSSNFTCSIKEQDNGCARVILVDFFLENLIDEGSGPIFVLNCDVSPSAPPGECRKLIPGNIEVANENLIPIDVQSVPGEFYFLSQGTIIIDECDTEVTDREIEDGLTMSDLIEECAISADGKQGKFKSCVSELTNGWKKDGFINGREKGAIQSCVGQ